MPSGPGNKDHPVLSKYGRSVSGCPQVNLAARDLLVLIESGRRAHAAAAATVSACGLRVRIRPTSAIVWLPSYAPGPLLGVQSPLVCWPTTTTAASAARRRTSSNLRLCFGVHFRREFQSDNLIRKLDGNRVQVSCFLFPPKFSS